MTDTIRLLNTPIPHWIREVAQRSTLHQTDQGEYQRRVYGALHTLRTHEETGQAWAIVLEDLIQSVLLRTTDNPEQAMFLEGQRQIVLRLLLGNQQAPDYVTRGGRG